MTQPTRRDIEQARDSLREIALDCSTLKQPGWMWIEGRVTQAADVLDALLAWEVHARAAIDDALRYRFLRDRAWYLTIPGRVISREQNFDVEIDAARAAFYRTHPAGVNAVKDDTV